MEKDNQLIIQIKNKDEQGLRNLIDQYAGLLKSVINKTLSALPQYQEECLNDVLLAIWQNIEQYDANKSSFKNWICVIAKYRAINFLKKYSKEIQNVYWEEEKHEASYAYTNQLLKNELWEIQLEELLAPLNEKDKKLFKEYFDSPASADTIAERNKLTTGALYSRISRGKVKNKEFFKKRGGVNDDRER